MEKTKKMAAVAFIAVLATLTFSTGLPTAIAYPYEHHDGICPPWKGMGYFCMCCHSSWNPGTYMDCWTSTGVWVDYNETEPTPPENVTVGYIRAGWIHQSATGGYYPQAGSLYCDFCINGAYHQYVYDWDTPQWMYYEPFWGYMNFYGDGAEWYNSTDFNPDVASVEGSTAQVFYDPYNPTHYVVIQSYTTPWSFLTAWYHSD